jgi:DNA-directed RNA polymerase specialized sigma24 family protein
LGDVILLNMSDTDGDLLARYAEHHAEEVVQSVFIKLAGQAGRFRPDSILTAWLYQVTRREAIDVIHREARGSYANKLRPR